MGWKKTVAFGLITLSVSALLVRNKMQKIIKHYESIKILPAGLSDLNVKWNDGKPIISFKVDFKFLNPLSEPFVFNGYLAKLQRIIIYDGTGKALGVSTPNIGKLTIPANGVATLPKVPFILDLQLLAINIINYKSLKLDSFKFESIVSILGAEYKIS